MVYIKIVGPVQLVILNVSYCWILAAFRSVSQLLCMVFHNVKELSVLGRGYVDLGIETFTMYILFESLMLGDIEAFKSVITFFRLCLHKSFHTFTSIWWIYRLPNITGNWYCRNSTCNTKDMDSSTILRQLDCQLSGRFRGKVITRDSLGFFSFPELELYKLKSESKLILINFKVSHLLKCLFKVSSAT